MSSNEGDSEPSPTWRDVQKEASALSREIAHQSLIWSRQAFRMASRAAHVAAKEAEKASKRASSSVKKIRKE